MTNKIPAQAELGRGTLQIPETKLLFVAVYLIPEDLWYVIPAEMIRGQGSVAVYPKLKKSKYGRYREACHLLGAASVEIQACAEWRAIGEVIASINLPVA